MTADEFRLPAWYVVFTPGRNRWWQRFLRPGFGHVFAFGWDEAAGVWLLFMLGWDGIVVRAMPHEWFAAFLARVQADGATVVLAKTMDHTPFRPKFLTTCVGAVEMLLGLPSRRALTPYGLYRTLIAHGAVPVMEK